MLALRAARRAQISIRVVLNSYAASAPVSSERQSACGAACGMLNALLPQRHHISTAAQPADAAISGRQPILTWLAHRQPAALLLGVRGYAKGSAKSKHGEHSHTHALLARIESPLCLHALNVLLIIILIICGYQYHQAGHAHSCCTCRQEQAGCTGADAAGIARAACDSDARGLARRLC